MDGMKQTTAILINPRVTYQESYLGALSEFHEEGINLDEHETEFKDNFSLFIDKLKDESLGKNLKPGYVPATTYWLVDGDNYIGRVSIRHTLNENLEKVGGHIGYQIRPSKRNEGYGKLILKLALPKTKELGLSRVLVTCDSTNIASRKIIEVNGGVLENEVDGESGEPTKLRFWIDLV